MLSRGVPCRVMPYHTNAVAILVVHSIKRCICLFHASDAQIHARVTTLLPMLRNNSALPTQMPDARLLPHPHPAAIVDC